MKRVVYVLLVAVLCSFTAKDIRLQFSEFEIKDENGVTRIAVNKTGEIKVGEQLVGKISKDGMLHDNNGELLAKITDDDILENKEGKSLVKIDKDGKLIMVRGCLLNGLKMESF